MSKTPKSSIKTRITLWYAALLLMICVAAICILMAVSEHAADEYCRETLVNASVVIIDELDADEGRLELDTDIDEVPGVYASLYDLNGTLIYGRLRTELPFEDGVIREVKDEADSWYVLDTLLMIEGRENVWLRVYMSANVNENVLRHVAASGAWLLPLLGLMALLGGYMITVRAFRPVKEMSELAASIADGNDLTRRVSFGGRSADELHMLANTLNEMLSRLEAAFIRESRFASDAAHELRTPLNAVRTQGEYALSREDVEEKDEAIASILEKNEQMRVLVDQLLMIARMDAGEMKREDICDLVEMIEAIREDMEIVAQEKNMNLLALLEPCTIMGHRGMLSRAVINLVDNAIRYGAEGGWVKIMLSREPGRIIIAVEDNGPGMLEEEREKAFERFWRADQARSTPGTGIGLAIVQAAAHAHGGEAAVAAAKDGGCRFTITLPC